MRKSISILLLNMFIVFPAISQDAPPTVDPAPVTDPAPAPVTDPAPTPAPTPAPVTDPAPTPVTDPAPVDSDVSPNPAPASDSDVSPSSEATPPPSVNLPTKPPETVGEAVESVTLIVTLIKNKMWLPLVGLVLMVLVFVLDRVVNLKKMVGEKGVPWVAAGLGMATHLALAFFVPGVLWWEALVSGLGSGVTAVGLWETVVKSLKS